MEIQARLKSAVSAAKTRSKLREELALVQDEQARAAQAWAEVEGLQAPSPALIEEIPELILILDNIGGYMTTEDQQAIFAARRKVHEENSQKADHSQADNPNPSGF
jgi:hypothetical protein